MNESGPGMDLEAQIPCPLDEVQCGNLEATIQGLTAHERMTLMSGFTCLMHELCVQVVSIFVTTMAQEGMTTSDTGGMGTSARNGTDADHAEDDEAEWEEDDNLMTMQLSPGLLTKTRATFDGIQTSLDGQGPRRPILANALLKKLKTMLSEAGTGLATEMEGLVAVLMVYATESVAPEEQDVVSEDSTWVTTWHRRLLHLIHEAQQGEMDQSSSSTTAILIDSQLPEEAGGKGGGESGRLADEKDVIQLVREFEAREAQRCAKLCEDLKLREAARAAKAQDEADLQEAMRASKRARLELEVCLQITAGEHHRRARFYVPMDTPDQAIQLQMSMRQVSHGNTTTNHQGDVEESTMVQTHLARTRRNHRSRLHHLLQALHAQIRDRVARQLQTSLERRLQDMLTQVAGLLGLLEGTVVDDDIVPDPAMNGEAKVYGTFLITHVEGLLTNLANLEPEHNLQDVLDDLGEVIRSYIAGTGDARRRRTAMSSGGTLQVSTLPTITAITSTANYLRDSIDGVAQIRGLDARPDILRAMIVHMVRDAQMHSSQLRILLLLLAHYLPQPRVLRQEAAQFWMDLARALWADHSQLLAERFHTNVAALGNEPIGFDEAVQVMDTLSTMAVETMSFLENGQCPLSTTPTNASGNATPPLLPPGVPARGRHGTSSRATRSPGTSPTVTPRATKPLRSSPTTDGEPQDMPHKGRDRGEHGTPVGRKRKYERESEGIKDEGAGSTGRTSDQGSKRPATTKKSESGQGSTRRTTPRAGEQHAPTESGTWSTPTKVSKTPSTKPRTLREGVERIFGKQ